MRKKTLFAQDNNYKAMLHTARWQKLRCQKLAENPFCEMCARQHRLMVATEVHHIQPVMSVRGWQREALMFDKDNLMSLCHDCHVAVHATLGKQSREENAKRKDDAMRKFCEKYGLNDND